MKPISAGDETLGVLKEDIQKVPSELDMRKLYGRIYAWHKKNHDKIQSSLWARTRKHLPGSASYSSAIAVYWKRRARLRQDAIHRNRYLNLVSEMPKPENAKDEDVFFICNEVICGLMEWAYHQQDEFGVKTGTYAHCIADKYGGGFPAIQKLAKKSRLQQKCAQRMRFHRSLSFRPRFFGK